MWQFSQEIHIETINYLVSCQSKQVINSNICVSSENFRGVNEGQKVNKRLRMQDSVLGNNGPIRYFLCSRTIYKGRQRGMISKALSLHSSFLSSLSSSLKRRMLNTETWLPSICAANWSSKLAAIDDDMVQIKDGLYVPRLCKN